MGKIEVEYGGADCPDKPHLCKVWEEDKDRASLCLETETYGAYYTYGKSAS